MQALTHARTRSQTHTLTKPWATSVTISTLTFRLTLLRRGCKVALERRRMERSVEVVQWLCCKLVSDGRRWKMWSEFGARREITDTVKSSCLDPITALTVLYEKCPWRHRRPATYLNCFLEVLHGRYRVKCPYLDSYGSRGNVLVFHKDVSHVVMPVMIRGVIADTMLPE